MRIRSIAYGIYLAISILFSITVAAIPAIGAVLIAYDQIDAILIQIGWPFADIQQFFQGAFGSIFPAVAFERFWFIVLLPTLALLCYGLFLALLAIMFRLSRRVIPFLEDGYYSMETEEWLLYEYYEVYYILFPYFAWFLSVFFDTKPRHTWFGADIGKYTVVGNGRLFNPERTIIGNHCFFGYDALMSGHVYEGDKLYLKTVKIGDNVIVGGNSVILPGADIGDNVIIGANTVVPKDKVIPPNTIWVHGRAIPRTPSQPELEKHQVIGGPFGTDFPEQVPEEESENTPSEEQPS